MLRVGARFASFELLECIGSGAAGSTWRARRDRDERLVALKVPHPRLLRDPSFVIRFLQEGNLGARLDSPYVVRVFSVGEHRGLPYLEMELLHGLTVSEALASSGPLQPRRALSIAADVAHALQDAHAMGVIHRDLKPANIMLRVGRCLKVMDLGVAKLVGDVGMTSSDMFIGTPTYAAPELVDAAKVDARVDIYALGITLFEMTQGHPPFEGRSPVEVLTMHRDRPLPPTDTLKRPLPGEVYALIRQLAAKDPDARISDARSARRAIEVVAAAI